MVKLEQKNCEPRDENIQLSGINTVCLRREWYFNVFTGLAHKYLWSVNFLGLWDLTVNKVNKYYCHRTGSLVVKMDPVASPKENYMEYYKLMCALEKE